MQTHERKITPDKDEQIRKDVLYQLIKNYHRFGLIFGVASCPEGTALESY